MNTTKNKKIVKLQESSRKRNEAWTELGKCVKLQQHNLPQEFVTDWENCERLAEEVKASEVKATNGIEQELDRLQKSEKEIFGLSQRVLGKMLVFTLLALISHLIVIYFSGIPEPKPVDSDFKYSPSLRLF